MKTAPIFVHHPPEDGLLHSLIYPEPVWDGLSVFNWWRKFWEDAERLRDFFKEQEHLLKSPFWQERNISRNKAITQVRKEADDFFFQLEDIHRDYNDTSHAPSLHELFGLLHKHEKGAAPYRYKAKAWDDRFCPMLRLYAIKLESGQMVITGGGIKLTEKMQDMPLLVGELERIDTVKQYIQKQQIACIADFADTEEI